MTTPLYPTFRKRIDDAVDQLIQNQVTPWSFLTAGPPFRVKKFDGKEIAYQGIGFEGSPRLVFWSRYIEPFLEDLAVREIGTAVASARERNVDAHLLLPEIQGLLVAATRKTFSRMADVDRRLRGKGFPEKIHLRNIDRELQGMNGFIEERIRAELAMWKPKPRIEAWYEQNKFWVWFIGIIATIAGICAKFL